VNSKVALFKRVGIVFSSGVAPTPKRKLTFGAEAMERGNNDEAGDLGKDAQQKA